MEKIKFVGDFIFESGLFYVKGDESILLYIFGRCLFVFRNFWDIWLIS